jgi:hypothetical protein
VEAHLKDATYDDASAVVWSGWVAEDIVAGLAELRKPFKYAGERRSGVWRAEGGGGGCVSAATPPLCRCRVCAVNVVIMQAVGAGVHVATSEYCDDVNDGEG